MHPSGGVRTYRRDRRGRRSGSPRVLRERGLGPGDHVAVLLDNQPEFFDVVWAAQRIGCYVTPINWHLTADEAGYIVARLRRHRAVRHRPARPTWWRQMGDDLAAVTTRICGRRRPARLRALRRPASPASTPATLRRPARGRLDVLLARAPPGSRRGSCRRCSTSTSAPSRSSRCCSAACSASPSDVVYLSPAPLYHAAPAGWTVGAQRLGGTAVVMERFDPLELLAAIERHRITHVQLVPTHMIRLLKLTDEERSPLRPVEPADGRPRGGAVPGRGEAGDASTGSARSSTSSTAAARAPASATSAPRTGSPTPARSASR